MENRKYLCKNLDGSTMFANIVVSEKSKRGELARQILTGIFYTLLIYGFVTPCDLLMQSRPLLGDGQWVVRNHFLFSVHDTNSFNMSESREKNLQGVKHSNPSATAVVRNTAISTSKTEKLFKQSYEKKCKKNFADSKKVPMFVTIQDQGIKINRKGGYFYILSTDLISDIRLFKSQASHSFLKTMVPWSELRGGQSFLFSNNSKFC